MLVNGVREQDSEGEGMKREGEMWKNELGSYGNLVWADQKDVRNEGRKGFVFASLLS